MDNPGIDIVVPVWNRPVETRNCLVNLVEHAPAARIILVDNGSERETERLLQEFAELLDQRALLLRNNVNQGHVRAVNQGLARAEAPFVAVVRSTALVGAGWLEPMLACAAARTDAGLLVPRLLAAAEREVGRGKQRDAVPVETDHASLDAMLVTRGLFAAIGGLDVEMDGGEWCLRDYSRRALKAGFLTFRVNGGPVRYSDEVPFGSPSRRAELLQRSMLVFRERWGETGSYCIHVPKGVEPSLLRERLDVLLKGARQGRFFTVLLPAGLYKTLKKEGWHLPHENITLEPLPPLFSAAAARNAIARCRQRHPDTVAVAAVDGAGWPGNGELIPFGRLEEDIAAVGRERYGAQGF